MSERKNALVIVLSEAHNDPRVRRQLTWLHRDGWTVDTIGLGHVPSHEVRDHFTLADQAPWVRTRVGSAVVYGLLPRRWMFRRVAVDRIPREALARIAKGEYDLVVFDDTDYIPLIKDPRVFTKAARSGHAHLDIHEYRESRQRLTPWRLLTRRYYRWQRSLIGDAAFDSRTTVASRIAEFYAEDFSIEPPALVRNSPPFHDQKPSPVDPSTVRLLFHGLASWARGFEQILDAMRLLDDRFSMTFMLTGNPNNIQRLREAAHDLGDRVRIVPPVPMTDLSAAVNAFDLEIMFYPPTHRNVEFALPNKFFEAVQGRLGIVVGESPMMAELVDQYEMGVVVKGWTGENLANALRALTPDEITAFKSNSDRAARHLNAETEGAVFIAAVTGSNL